MNILWRISIIPETMSQVHIDKFGDDIPNTKVANERF